MKTIKKNALNLLALASLSVLWTLAAFSPMIVSADQPPLAPGCYVKDVNEFTPANCTGGNQEDKCYVAGLSSRGVGPFSEVSCETGDLRETGGSSGFLTQSPFEKNDCKTDSNTPVLNKDNCGIIRYLVLFIQVLSGIAGVAIVASLVMAGIQYSSAGSDPQKVSAAKNRIRNAIIALVFFLFGVAFLNYIVPGGVL